MSIGDIHISFGVYIYTYNVLRRLRKSKHLLIFYMLLYLFFIIQGIKKYRKASMRFLNTNILSSYVLLNNVFSLLNLKVYSVIVYCMKFVYITLSLFRCLLRYLFQIFVHLSTHIFSTSFNISK